MRILLLALIVFMTLSSVFAWDPGPMTGIKIKNGILYLLIFGLLLRFAIDRRFKLELPGVHLAFGAVLAYAILTYLAVVLVIQYPRYDVMENGFNLKAYIDQFLFFLVFFYGIRSQKDGIFLLKCLLAAFALSHAMALLDAFGLVHFGEMELRADGRVQGLVGESNQYGAFVALSLPALIAVCVPARGFERFLWVTATILTALTLVMTVSRGAFVAVVVASVWALFLFRNHTSPGRLAMWIGAGMTAGILAVTITIALGFGHLLYERLVSDTVATDMVTTSSGRTQIWANAIARMFEEPVTLLTGYGWRAYWTMPFRFSPHNYYVNQWFNLGLIGLVCSVLLFAWPIKIARAAAAVASDSVRPLLIGFAIAALTYAVATFFVDLYIPWLYFWAYAGIVLRLAVLANESAPSLPQPVAAPRATRSRAQPAILKPTYGWSAASPHPSPSAGGRGE